MMNNSGFVPVDPFAAINQAFQLANGNTAFANGGGTQQFVDLSAVLGPYDQLVLNQILGFDPATFPGAFTPGQGGVVNPNNPANANPFNLDPNTGLPLPQAIDPATGQPVPIDPATGQPIQPAQGAAPPQDNGQVTNTFIQINNGQPITPDALVGQLVNLDQQAANAKEQEATLNQFSSTTDFFNIQFLQGSGLQDLAAIQGQQALYTKMLDNFGQIAGADGDASTISQQDLVALAARDGDPSNISDADLDFVKK